MNTKMVVIPIVLMLVLIFTGIGIAVGGPILVEGYEDVRIETSSTTDIETSEIPAASNSENHTTSTLVYAPFAGLTSSVTSVSSNRTGDSGISVDSVSDTSVNITGFPDTTENRTVTLVYNYSSLDQYNSADTVVESSPTLFLLGYVISGAVVGMLGVAIGGIGVYGAYKKVRQGK